MASDSASPVSQHEHRSGELVAGRYQLLRKLGEGGMGVVWVARSTALDVDVALKMLKRELAGTEAVERMAREARTAAQLGHPAMVRVLDFGTSEQGEPFLAMELLEGEELHSRLHREQRLPATDAAALLLPIIDGLGTAHEKGIVHRDIKPENIFIAKDGQQRVQPKLLDFGIAKLSNDRAPSRLTQVGAVMGSPYYLSPEQAEGLEDIDSRCDIWAIGVVLYELVTGAPPFAGNNYNALIRSILRDEPKPITEQGVGDAQLWLIIDRCLKKDPGERWATMWEVGEALALWLFERGVRVDAAARSLRHDWLEGAITGVKMLVTSQAPDAEDLPSIIVDPQISESPRQDRLAKTHLRPRRRAKKAPVALLLVAGAALAGLAGALAYQFHAQNQASAASGAELTPPATVALKVIPAAPPQPSTSPSTTAPAASAEVEVAPAADSAPSASAARAVPAAAPRVTEPKPRPKPPSRPASGAGSPERVRHNTEFGF